MAIKKCPYCKAIIDESAQYCANCGTQLLFPEDEEIEEGIPGDKIVEEEEKAEEKETAEAAEGMVESTQEEQEVEWKKRKVSSEEEVIEEESRTREELESLVGRKKEETAEERPHSQELSGESQKKEQIEEIGEVGDKAFETADLERIEDAGEVKQEEVEGILSEFRKKEKEETAIEEEIPEKAEELPPWAEKIKEVPAPEISVEFDELEKRESVSPPKEVLPPEEDRVSIPPAEESKEEPLPPGEEEELLEKASLEAQGVTTESGIGLPEEEEEEQRGLPFEEEEEFEEDELDRGGYSFSIARFSRFKARLFDIGFITVLWLVTIWYASRLIEVSLGTLVRNSAPAVFGFYIILIACYFFLFLFFLGRTLGDRLFFPEV
ncbi:MAG: zinc ribbon domain-containing protein [Candidatus Aminicenantales bacterium]